MVHSTPLQTAQQDICLDDIRSEKRQVPVTGRAKKRLHRRRLLKNAWIVVQLYKWPWRILRVLNQLRLRRNALAGAANVHKLVCVEGQHLWRLHLPPWESPKFDRFVHSELQRIQPHESHADRLALAHLAITKKCPLRCEHCFEWDNLNKPEALTTSDIDTMVDNLLSVGTANIAFSGGEPMLRVHEIVNTVRRCRDKSQFWVLTSGFNFTAAHAKSLKEAGLMGVVVSIDDLSPDKHDAFRGKPGSFKEALEAVKHAMDQGLVTAISTCVTRDKANPQYLHAFMDFAKDLGVGFVQLLEPKPVGHYALQDVLLREPELRALEECFLSCNADDAYREHPIVIYHGYYQRRVGCLAAGNLGVYVDTNGDFMSCPFCHKKNGSLLDSDFEQNLNDLQAMGCDSYGQFGLS